MGKYLLAHDIGTSGNKASIENDEMFLTFGTSAWIGGTTEKKFLDDDKIFFCFAHVIPGKYMPCGTMQSAGSSYSYVRNTFCQDVIQKAKEEGISSWDLMNAMAEKSPAGAKGDIVAQILADVLEVSLVRPDHVEEATSIAAAVIAGVGCGIYEDFEAIHKFLKFRTPVEPDFGKKDVYDRQKKIFDDVYQALVPFYREMNCKKTI